MALEVSGVRLAVEGASQAIKNLTSFNTALEASQKAQDKLSKASGVDVAGKFSGKAFNDLISGATKSKSALDSLGSSKVSSFFQQLSTSFPGVTQGLTSLGEKALTAFPALGNLTSGMQGLAAASPAVIAGLGAAVAAIIGVTVAAKAFFALGSRGAALEPVIAAFGNIVGGSQDSTQALNTLRAQTRGTISDLELMRLSVASLKGTSATFKSAVSGDLGTIIDLTGRIAAASGDSADVVREKFLLGLRRQSAKLVDDVGVMVDAEKAYQDYAKSIGVATAALTDQQKQAAFAQEAIKQLKVIGEEIGTPAATLENLKAPAVALQNILNKLALAVQPLFAPIAKTIADIAHGFENLASYVIPLVYSGFQVLGTIFTQLQAIGSSIFNALFGDIIQVASVALPYLVAAAQLALEGFSAIIETIGSVITGLIDTFGSLFPSLGENVATNIDDLARRVGQGGGKIVGSFAAGLLQGGTKVIQAAAKIANLVADFLQGFSPPKKGALSHIDEGGTNVINAWAQGFLKANLTPVDQVAANVNEQLGSIGKLSANQVANQLASLDKAIQPFNDQLTIAKATLEKVAGFADPALKAIERQTEKAIKAGDAAKLQQLDQQAQALKALKSQEQDRVDKAELQLALAKSQQAQERALLGIQQARVGAAKELVQAGGGGVGAVEKATTAAKEEKAKAGKGGEAPAQEALTGGIAKGTAPDLINSGAIQKARDNLVGGISEGLASSGYDEALAGFEQQTGNLKNALGRIKEADPLGSISKKLDPVKTAFDDLKTGIDTVKLGIETAVSGLASSIGTALGESGVAATAISFLDTTITTLQATVETVKTAIDTALTGIATKFTTTFGAEGTLYTTLSNLVGETGILGATGLLQTAFSTLFGEEGTIGTALTNLETKFSTFVTNVALTLGTFKKGVEDLIETPINAISTTIKTVLDDVKTQFTDFAGGDIGLSSLGKNLGTLFVTPFVSAVNGIIGAINTALENFANSVGASFISKFLDVNVIPSIPSVPVPTFAGGAIGYKGTALVGERGAELVNFGKPANIFPAPLTQAIMSLANKPMPIIIDSGGSGGRGNTYNNQRSMQSTFNVGSPEQARLLERQRAAFYGF